MSFTRLLRTFCACVGAVLIADAAVGQPATFVELGQLRAPASPPYAREFIEDPGLVEYQTPPLEFAVRWARFELAEAVSGDLFLDIDGRNYNVVGVTYALYSSTGQFLVADDTDGSFPYGSSPGLSFGSSAERVPWSGPNTRGQDGPLAAGVYWLAVVAGPRSEITFGPSWSISTPSALPIGFDSGELDLEVGIVLGNTSPHPPPVNDDCEDAILISENIGAAPAWTGDNLGATQDGFSSCYAALDGLTYKDIWFRYVPSASGWATVRLNGGAGGGATPILTRYVGDCGSAQVRCSGGGSFASPVGTRLTFEVVQGVPVLLSAAVRAGRWAPLSLSVSLIGPPCDTHAPTNAIPEREAACGNFDNEGCLVFPPSFDLVQLGETVRGRLYNTTAVRDTDTYLLHLPFATNIRLTAVSQLPFTLTVRALNASGCPSGNVASVSSLFYDALCQPETLDFQGVGVYAVTIIHSALDGFDCASGHGEYWIRAEDPACAYPTFTQQPAAIAVCAGETAIFNASPDAGAPVASGWEWELVLNGLSLWRPVTDGVFADAGSSAIVSGATTGTLRISGIDAAAAVRFRATATTCGTARSRPARLTLRAAGECSPACAADFNSSGDVTVQDIFDFLTAYFTNSAPADVNGSGEVTVQDIFDYLLLYFTGC